MHAGTLTIYSASAGSGKTHKLAGIYLEKLFKSRLSYRKILAVTFTNKATAEMKTRILDELNNLALGLRSKYVSDLVEATGKSEEAIRNEARVILYSLLHDFSRFSVSTIDSFYQKIIRAFARDIGLHSGFNIEIDHAAVLSSAVDNVIASSAFDTKIKNWLSLFARANIEEGKSWDLKKSILGLSEELFKEKFKLLSTEQKNKIEDKGFLSAYIREIRSVSSAFTENLRQSGLKCLKLFDKYGLTDDMFFYKDKGVPAFVKSIAGGIVKAPNTYVRALFNEPPKWCPGSINTQLACAINDGLEKYIKEAVTYFNRNYVAYKTASTILSNIYILGILSDVLNQVHLITSDENIFLLSDAGELIYLITCNDQAPFIYEKVGNAYENFMIDEFQDTSTIQWKNFRQLIDNSMAQGFDNLVVGDIKQSIYRWRNSDWRTLRDLIRKADKKRYIFKPLNTNYRSCTNIIKFNNALFTIIPHNLDEELSDNEAPVSFKELFSEAVQSDPLEKQDGYIRIEFIDNSDESSWRDIVLNKIPLLIENIEDKGYRPSDIGILVRDNREGARVLREVIEYSVSCSEEKRKKYNYNIVSGESLLLANSPAVNFILAVLMILDNPENMIARALMLRYYLLSLGKEDADRISLAADDLTRYSAGFFPEGYIEFLNRIEHEPLWNITESVIHFFGLGNYSHNVPYLNSFQDIVLDYTTSGNKGLSSFLEWWETDGFNKSIILPEQQDAIKVLTIHKSKGLEFRIVILPFLSWNLDHKTFHRNILWVEPDSAPFNKSGIVPVRYSSDLTDTIFAKQYYEEKYSSWLDNLNLLYVSFTRAVNGLIGFAPCQPRYDNRIAKVLRDALSSGGNNNSPSAAFLNSHFDPAKEVFEFGILPETEIESSNPDTININSYPVNFNFESLKLKLHWENYLSAGRQDIREKVQYGKLMHEIFSGIIYYDDVKSSVRKKVIEGIIRESEENEIRSKIENLLANPDIRKWFEKGIVVLNEAAILMPDSSTRRPDRIILKDGKATIIDFKFGEEHPHYLNQVRQYKKIIGEMGYEVDGAYLWFVDSDKIISV